jgi:hypothetical protein
LLLKNLSIEVALEQIPYWSVRFCITQLLKIGDLALDFILDHMRMHPTFFLFKSRKLRRLTFVPNGQGGFTLVSTDNKPRPASSKLYSDHADCTSNNLSAKIGFLSNLKRSFSIESTISSLSISDITMSSVNNASVPSLNQYNTSTQNQTRRPVPPPPPQPFQQIQHSEHPKSRHHQKYEYV